jgi:DnaJ-domain-containing protein 1
VDQIFDRFERMFRSWVSADADELFGRTHTARAGASSGDPDLDAAMDELNDFLDTGRTETEARERDRARREREAAARAGGSYSGASSSYNSRPSGPPPALVQAYKVLGLPYGAPFPEVKAAYKRLLMQNHPDRNSATPEQLKRSTEISVQINAAYQRIEDWTTKGKLDE